MWGSAGERYGVALDVADPELADALAEALLRHPALRLVEEEAAEVVVADYPRPGALDIRALPEGAGAELILAAALVTASGLRVVPGEAAAPGEAPRLSPREREVLGLLVDGAPNKAIARALGITERTAKFHVAAVLAKLGARNRAEAVGRALREGLGTI